VAQPFGAGQVQADVVACPPSTPSPRPPPTSATSSRWPAPPGPERAHALAYTPTDDLLGLPILGPDAGFITGTDLLMDGGVIAALRAGRWQLQI
jgi:hypothetical protein